MNSVDGVECWMSVKECYYLNLAVPYKGLLVRADSGSYNTVLTDHIY